MGLPINVFGMGYLGADVMKRTQREADRTHGRFHLCRAPTAK